MEEDEGTNTQVPSNNPIVQNVDVDGLTMSAPQETRNFLQNHLQTMERQVDLCVP